MKKRIGCGLLVVAGLGLLVAGSSGLFRAYRDLVRREVAVSAACADFGNLVQRQIDLISSLLEVARNRIEGASLRSAREALARGTGTILTPAVLDDPARFERFLRSESELSSVLQGLVRAVEKDALADRDAHVRDLCAEARALDSRIASVLEEFDGAVRAYNEAIRSFPTSALGAWLGKSPKPRLEEAAAMRRPR